jgi:hypothetical protein
MFSTKRLIGNLFNQVVAQEAIDFQLDRKFFLALVEECTKGIAAYNDVDIKKDRVNKEIVNTLNENLSRIIQIHTGIDANLTVELVDTLNAYVRPPLITRGHPLVTELWRFEKELSKDAESIIRGAKNLLQVGWVDLKHGMVHGIYQKFEVPITVFAGCFKKMTAEEIAAIILHEVGHAFVYFEYLGSAVTRNFAMAAISQAILKSDTHERKVVLIKKATQELNLNNIDPELGARVKDINELQVLLVNSEVQRLRSELGSDVYDVKGWEYLADQFAARQGASAHVVSAIDKIHKHYGDGSRLSTASFIILEIVKLIWFIGISMASFGFVGALIIMLGVLVSPITDVYDKPRDRFKRIRQQVVEALKDVTNTQTQNRQLLDDLEAIDETIRYMEQRLTLFEFIFVNIIPKHRKQYNQQLLQKELEQIAMNDLFVASAKLKLM